MVQSKFVRAIAGITLSTLLTAAFVVGCGGKGNTDGGKGNDDAGVGTQYVSDGGSGSTLTIAIRNGATTLAVGATTGFSVTALDASGAPLPFIRISCDSEHGITILEPSDGGVAFEHTNEAGFMSGVIGGLNPGSYILECRGPQGFNLKDRVSIVITGEVPEGFNGWPGAAGGNLGGGLTIDPPDEDVTLTDVSFTSAVGVGGRQGFIDIPPYATDCDGDPATVDPEPFGFDSFEITIANGREDRVTVDSVVFTVFDGTPGGVTVTVQGADLVIPAGSSTTVSGTFTAFDAALTKIWPGTSAALVAGVYDVTFTVRMLSPLDGVITDTITATITVDQINNCPA